MSPEGTNLIALGDAHDIEFATIPTLKGSNKKGTPMAQTLVSLMVHVIFSTKNREPLITHDIEPELFAYMGGILNNLHLLISQSKNIALSSLMKDLKKDSSLWIK